MSFLFFFSGIVLFYVYCIFPLFMYFSKRCFESNDEFPKSSKTFSVVIPSHNEEKVIAQKIENHLALKGSDIRIIVLCDSCTDGTVGVAQYYALKFPDVVSVFVVEDFKGKTNAINKVVPTIDSDIIVFTDANVMLDDEAIINLDIEFDNPFVGGVAGQLTYVNEDVSDAAATNGLYWRYEEMIKLGESAIGSINGADGSIFAIRRELYRELPEYVLDDFCTSMGVVIQGKQFKLSPKVRAYEKGAESASEELSRKIRISNRSYNSYRYLRKDILSNLKLKQLVMFYSHKVLRWYSFLFMLALMLSNLTLVFSDPSSGFYAFSLISQCLYYLIAFSHIKGFVKSSGLFSKLARTSSYFLMVNYAAAIGIMRAWKGDRVQVWKKAESTR
ncbi:hypothetical protein CN03_05505 [Thalassolituus oleivorans]|uniref:glycosyltransferase n=1 Tax=Thalassolituus oleivorans TaxID=187493 RepID=UPI0009492C7C|nr:glycosyltransferase [Thalassolituus oleivorans]APR66441.1 hypothetical protein CN03_05505 [Thalassolituus oleivorans]